MLKLRDELKEQIAYVLIGLILISAIIPLVIDIDSKLIIGCKAIVVGALAGFYLLIAEKKDLFFVTFALFVCQTLVLLLLPGVTPVFYKIIHALPLIAAAVAFGILAYKHSKEFKAFELLEFLLAFFLLICASKSFVSTEFDIYYAFCLSFLIATLMYNNNMWMRYQDTEKDLLLFLLVVAFADVIQASAKFISF